MKEEAQSSIRNAGSELNYEWSKPVSPQLLRQKLQELVDSGKVKTRDGDAPAPRGDVMQERAASAPREKDAARPSRLSRALRLKRLLPVAKLFEHIFMPKIAEASPRDAKTFSVASASPLQSGRSGSPLSSKSSNPFSGMASCFGFLPLFQKPMPGDGSSGKLSPAKAGMTKIIPVAEFRRAMEAQAEQSSEKVRSRSEGGQDVMRSSRNDSDASNSARVSEAPKSGALPRSFGGRSFDFRAEQPDLSQVEVMSRSSGMRFSDSLHKRQHSPTIGSR